MPLQIQHSYAHASNFPNELHGRTAVKLAEMNYHYSVLVSQNRQDMMLQKDRVTVRSVLPCQCGCDGTSQHSIASSPH